MAYLRNRIGNAAGDDHDDHPEDQATAGNRQAGLPVMHLIPSRAWWIAAWSLEGQDAVISVDICTPPALAGGEWRYIDLELDPHTFADGRVEILDEDEFLAACEADLISPSEAINARAAARDVECRMRDRIEPFGRLGWERLHHAVGSALPPITVLPEASTA